MFVSPVFLSASKYFVLRYNFLQIIVSFTGYLFKTLITLSFRSLLRENTVKVNSAHN